MTKKKFLRTAAAVGIVTCLTLIGFTVAFLTESTATLTNAFTLGTFGIEIDEPDWVPDPSPSQSSVAKTVKVKNTGSMDAFVRVAIVPTFRIYDGGSVESQMGVVDYSTVNSGYILVTAPDGVATYKLMLASGWSSKWFFEKGVFYRNDPLPAGTTSEALMSSVTRTDGDAWNGLDIEVMADAVQTQGTVTDAIKNWDAKVVSGKLARK